jgi:hypothetical protein
MKNIKSALATALMASVVAVAMGPFAAAPASAFPLGPAAGALTAQLADATPAIPVFYRGGFRGGIGYRGGWGYRGGGWGVGAGIAGGLVLGGIIASQSPYYSGYYGSYGYPAPYYGGYGYGGNAVAYCASRFRSYDPSSGTYLGYDGYRHPCP